MSSRLEERALAEMQGFVRPLGKQSKPTPAPIVTRASDLMQTVLPPVRWAVRDILPEGVALLVGAPKIGKSWLALQVALSVVGARPLWPHRVPEVQGEVLYLALEDNNRRMQSRIAKLQQHHVDDTGRRVGSLDLSRLHYSTQWPRMDHGGIAHIEKHLVEHPETRLVIIDTLAKFRRQQGIRDNAYQADYQVGADLKHLADRYQVAILLLHHTRKQDAADVLETISGTQGLAGSVDAILILRRERGQMDAALYVTGRDVEREEDYALTFDTAKCCWSSSGTVQAAQMTQKRQAVVQFLELHGPSWPRDIATGLSKKQPTTRRLLQKMFADGQISVLEDGRYTLPHVCVNSVNGGNAGGAHPAAHDVHSVHTDTAEGYANASRGL